MTQKTHVIPGLIHKCYNRIVVAKLISFLQNDLAELFYGPYLMR